MPPLRQAAVKDADPVTQRVVAQGGALAMMEVEIPEQVTALRKYFGTMTHDLVRMKAAHALGMIGLAAKVAAPEIVIVLERATDSLHAAATSPGAAGQHRRSGFASGTADGEVQKETDKPPAARSAGAISAEVGRKGEVLDRSSVSLLQNAASNRRPLACSGGTMTIGDFAGLCAAWTVVSIFMASSMTSFCPAVTSSPSSTLTRTIRPGIGAATCLGLFGSALG